MIYILKEIFSRNPGPIQNSSVFVQVDDHSFKNRVYEYDTFTF